MKQPFAFYGGYVAMSAKEKQVVMDNKVVVYYRDCVCELR